MEHLLAPSSGASWASLNAAHLGQPASPLSLPSGSALAGRPLTVVVVLLAWLACGVIVGVVAARRDGHEVRALGALGLVLGPLMVGLAFGRAWRTATRADEVEITPRALPADTLTVMVVVAGDPSEAADAEPVIASLGSTIGEVIVARPVTHEAARDAVTERLLHPAAVAVSTAALFLAEHWPSAVLLPGRPVDAVAGYAHRHDIGVVIVIGGPDLQAALGRHPLMRGRSAVTSFRRLAVGAEGAVG